MSKVIPTNIDEAIARVDDWKGKSISYEPVAGGITNPNYKVNVDGKNYFLKIPGAGTDFIDRENCHEANMIADKSGAGAKVCYYFPDTAVEIFEWLEGYRTSTTKDMLAGEWAMKGVDTIKKFHELPGAKLPVVQSIFDYNRDMVDRAKQGDYIPPYHDRMQWLMSTVEEAMDTYGIEIKPCHKDYWYNNFMINEETGDAKIIDLEYAAMSDPIFDLGEWMFLWSTEEMERQAIIRYNGGVYDEILFGRMKLDILCCDIAWSYWSLQQAVNSDVEFNYYDWYLGKITRLYSRWNDPRIDNWISLLKGRPVWRCADAWKGC